MRFWCGDNSPHPSYTSFASLLPFVDVGPVTMSSTSARCSDSPIDPLFWACPFFLLRCIYFSTVRDDSLRNWTDTYDPPPPTVATPLLPFSDIKCPSFDRASSRNPFPPLGKRFFFFPCSKPFFFVSFFFLPFFYLASSAVFSLPHHFPFIRGSV